MMDHLLAAYERDIYIRLYGAEPANNTGHKAVVHEVAPGIVFEDESAKITAFAVRHGTWPTAFGYKFETDDRSIVVSGDAAPSEEIIRQCSGCDVLVHEVYLEDEIEGISTQEMDWAKYFRGFHTSATELGQLAARAKPELLVLYHQIVLAPETEDEILKEIRKSFKGNLVSGRDLDVF